MAVFGVGKVLSKLQAQVQSWSSVRDGRGREVIREIPIKQTCCAPGLRSCFRSAHQRCIARRAVLPAARMRARMRGGQDCPPRYRGF
jgi:hypothetical protein